MKLSCLFEAEDWREIVKRRHAAQSEKDRARKSVSHDDDDNYLAGREEELRARESIPIPINRFNKKKIKTKEKVKKSERRDFYEILKGKPINKQLGMIANTVYRAELRNGRKRKMIHDARIIKKTAQNAGIKININKAYGLAWWARNNPKNVEEIDIAMGKFTDREL